MMKEMTPGDRSLIITKKAEQQPILSVVALKGEGGGREFISTCISFNVYYLIHVHVCTSCTNMYTHIRTCTCTGIRTI